MEKRRASDGQYTMRPFPLPKVNEFMVSKAFFVSAAKAYMGNQPLLCNRPGSIDLIRALTRPGICAAFLKTLEADVAICGILGTCVSLKSLTTRISYHDFSARTHEPWEQAFDEDALLKCGSLPNLLELRGLQHFSAMPERCTYAKTTSQQQMWESNVRRLEALVRSRVLLPKQRAVLQRVAGVVNPLCEGSSVCAGPSRPTPKHFDALSHATKTPAPRSIFDVGLRKDQTGSSELDNEDVPDKLEAFHLLLLTKGAEVMRWVQDAKAALRGQ
ncbi:hypothetical protein LTR36_002186 [Oleoguttula mirabilis]|uniref:Uncharacterized protein n=1 Tax=Oleoguttula mirabilis TaxID=1507867 RepID=A0AAV9JL33_9PEZI|nr:hypothetical protein LTR36_002186 [Oleoguttula mirabilis]